MITLALIGKNISHSLSAEIYRDLLGEEINYNLIDCASEEELPSLEELFPKYDGVSITSPYKKYYRDKVVLDSCCEGINCVSYENGTFRGTNTDNLALQKLIPEMIQARDSIVVLGNGVMASLVQSVLEDMGRPYIHYYRSKYGDISSIDLGVYSDLIVINCCGRSFTFKGALRSNQALFWDLNYRSSIQQKAIERQSVDYVDGVELLKLQAKYALSFWELA